MNAFQEINVLVKKAQSEPIDYFSGISEDDPDLADIRAQIRAGNQQARNQSGPNQFVGLSTNRQAVVMPKWNGAGGTGWTGREVRQGGSAPPSRVDQSQINPHYATDVFMPGQGGKSGYLAGGGKLDVGPDGNLKPTVGGRTVRRWEDLPSTRMMMAANNPSINTPQARRDKMMAYMPNSMRARKAKPPAQPAPASNIASATSASPAQVAPAGPSPSVASAPQAAPSQGTTRAQPFDFKSEARNLLGQFKNEVAGNTAAHGMVNEMARNMAGQLKNLGSMSEDQQRQLLDQWKSQVNGMRAQIANMGAPKAPSEIMLGNSPARPVMAAAPSRPENASPAGLSSPEAHGAVTKTTLPNGSFRKEGRWQGIPGGEGMPGRLPDWRRHMKGSKTWNDFVKSAGPSLKDRAAVGDRRASAAIRAQSAEAAKRISSPSPFTHQRQFVRNEGKKILSQQHPLDQRKFWEDANKFQSDAIRGRGLAASAMPGLGVAARLAMPAVGEFVASSAQRGGVENLRPEDAAGIAMAAVPIPGAYVLWNAYKNR